MRYHTYNYNHKVSKTAQITSGLKQGGGESGVGVPGVWVLARSRNLSFKVDSGPYLSHLDLNFVAVNLTFMQFIFQIKLCLCTTVHLLLEEFKNLSQVILRTQSVCHTISPRVGV